MLESSCCGSCLMSEWSAWMACVSSVSAAVSGSKGTSDGEGGGLG